eukprot:TRINITY_DN48609_c0_g1_i1.p1 TRINITY_DN48609_c0_g1~~TRINITY_DN48609_c0_g1_i1.p1  ORF type:complete len:352 (-),score=88.28 TRINITY_DN48609_c0_g1_i1:476-1531(-)
MGNACTGDSSGGSIDEEEVQLFVRQKAAEGEVKNWKKRTAILDELEDELEDEFPTESDFHAEAVDAGDGPSTEITEAVVRGKGRKKTAIARLVRSFVHGRSIEVSSSSIGTRCCIVKIDRGLTQLILRVPRLPGENGPGTLVIPLIRVLEINSENPPGADRYNFGGHCIVKLRLGPHGGHGPEMMLLQLRSNEECEDFSLCIRACAQQLRQEAAWEKQRAMDEESVPSTVVRAVGLLRDPLGLGAASVLSKPKKHSPGGADAAGGDTAGSTGGAGDADAATGNAAAGTGNISKTSTSIESQITINPKSSSHKDVYRDCEHQNVRISLSKVQKEKEKARTTLSRIPEELSKL